MNSNKGIKNLAIPKSSRTMNCFMIFIFFTMPLIFSCAGSAKKVNPIPDNKIIYTEPAASKHSVKPVKQSKRSKNIITHAKTSGYHQSKSSNLPGYKVVYQGKSVDLGRLVRRIALNLQAQKLYYNSRKLTDCSGIFHRVIGEMRKICPNYDYPSPTRNRSSRDLARWYFERGELVPVNDPIKMAHLIKPGAVMFFAHRGKNIDNFAGKRSFNANIVSHIGIVVAVEKDAAGRVISYQLFHGRSRGKIASITKYHYRNPSKKYLPPFGNYDQPLVAIARMFGP